MGKISKGKPWADPPFSYRLQCQRQCSLLPTLCILQKCICDSNNTMYCFNLRCHSRHLSVFGRKPWVSKPQTDLHLCLFYVFVLWFCVSFFGESRSSFGELVGLKPINNLNVKMEIFCLFFDTQVAALLSLHLSFKAIKFKLKKPSINKTQTKQPITY